MTGILIYRPKWRLHMAVASAWFTSHIVPICVEGALLRVSLTHTRPPPSHPPHTHKSQLSLPLPTHSSRLCRKIRSGNSTCHFRKAVVCGLSLWGPGTSELGRCPVIPRWAGRPCGNDSWAHGEGADTVCRAEERP